MTTLEPEQRDILEKLNEVALAENWGTVDRAHTAECPNGIPKGVAVIMESIEEIKRLRQRNEELYDFKRKLEDELIDQGFAEYADEKFKTLSDYKAEIAEAKELCRKKIGDLKNNEWLKIMMLAGYQVAVSQKELIDETIKKTVGEILQEYSKMLIDSFVESGNNECNTVVSRVLKKDCPQRIKTIKRLYAQKYGVEIDNE